MKYVIALFPLLVSLTPAWALRVSETPDILQCHHLPGQRIACGSASYTVGKFNCRSYGNFSAADFETVFQDSGPAVRLPAIAGAFRLKSEKTSVVQPCLESSDEDGAPNRCLRYEENRYRYVTRIYELKLSATARLNAECDDYALGRIKL